MGDATSTAKINRWTGKFRSKDVEASFQRYADEKNRRSNELAVMIALPLNTAYLFFDPFMLSDAAGAVRIRVAALAFSALAFVAMKTTALRRAHDVATALIMVVLGGAMNAIMWNEPSLAGDYYVGLIQGGVFMSFVVRIGLWRLVACFAVTLSSFFIVAFSRGRPEEATLQCLALTTMYFVCAFGVYLLETMRRSEFDQARTIAEQNRQLNAMLAEVQLDNARKVAAMNLLVHFVKTPIHQIVGFTDVIRNQIEGMGAGGGRDGCLESAAFIQSASKDLSRNVSRLLAYYRLDEKAAAAPDLIELDTMIVDHLERLPAPPRASLDRVAIVNRKDVVSDAVQTMIDRYADNRESHSFTGVRIERSDAAATIIFTDKGPAISPEEFAQQTRPLDKLDHYLTANGSSMMLGLRTVARAAEICGGALRHRRDGDENVYSLELPDLAAKNALADKQVA
ncbi:MAG: hypothetical protein ACK4NP_14090 [Parvularculaceae bacterium]